MTHICTSVAIIGADPYGLSIATQLESRGLDYRIVGKPMRAWMQMPNGMLLKSDGFAPNLHEPTGRFTLKRFCAHLGEPYADIGKPVRLETFVSYGLAFQKQFVPNVINTHVVGLQYTPAGFDLQLENREKIHARAVIVAVGLSYYQFIPAALTGLPKAFLSHSSDCDKFARCVDGEVIIIGGGSSAIDLAVLLQESNVPVRLVARRQALEFHSEMKLPRPLWDRIRRPLSGVGPGWRSGIYCDAPDLFYHLPEWQCLKIAGSFFRPGRRLVHEGPNGCGASTSWK